MVLIQLVCRKQAMFPLLCMYYEAATPKMFVLLKCYAFNYCLFPWYILGLLADQTFSNTLHPCIFSGQRQSPNRWWINRWNDAKKLWRRTMVETDRPTDWQMHRYTDRYTDWEINGRTTHILSDDMHDWQMKTDTSWYRLTDTHTDKYTQIGRCTNHQTDAQTYTRAYKNMHRQTFQLRSFSIKEHRPCNMTTKPSL